MLLLSKRASYGLILLFCCLNSPAIAQGTLTPQPRQEPYIQGETSFFGYYEYLPEGYDTDTVGQFPLLIYLSGLESRGDGIVDLDTLLENGVGKVIKEGRQFPFLTMMPQSIGGFWNPDRVNEYLDFIVNNYRVDTSRIYITGISAGGSGAFSYAVLFPEKIAAVVPIAGRGNNLDMCVAKDVPIWAFHNADDTVFSHVSSIIPIDNLNKCEPPPALPGKVTIYPSGGHDAWTKTYDGSGMGTEDTTYDAFDMDIFEWMLQFAKDTILVDVGADQFFFRPKKDLLIEAYAASHNGLHTYGWSQLAGPEIDLDAQDAATLEIKDIPTGTYTFVLTVTDNFERSRSDTIQVVARPPNAPPVVDVGEDQTIWLPVDSVVLNATASDPENDALSFEWAQETGPAGAALQYEESQLVIKNLEDGVYTFRLTVTDEYDSARTDAVQLTVITPIPDVGITAIHQPDTSRFPYTSEEKVMVTIKNYSNVPQHHFEVGYQLGDGIPVVEIVTDTIAPDSAKTYIFNMSADMSLLQNYTIQAYTALPDDVNPENDSIHLNLNRFNIIHTFPYAESFEQTNAGWRAYGENNSWERGQPVNTAIDTASDGTMAWVTGLAGDYLADEASFLLSPVFDFSNFAADPVITYDVWQVIASGDSARLSVTTDGGANWQSLDLVSDGFLTKDSAKWITVTRTLEGLAGEKSVLLRFEFYSDSMDNNEGVALDHFFICSMLPEILAIPDTVIEMGTVINIPVEVENATTAALTFYAFSSNQELIPHENIQITENILGISPADETEGEAEILVYARDNCISQTSFQITVAAITATEPEIEKSINVYPNPGTGIFTIEMIHSIKAIDLLGPTGQRIQSFSVNPYQPNGLSLDMSAHPAGLYYLRVATAKGIVTKKLIKH